MKKIIGILLVFTFWVTATIPNVVSAQSVGSDNWCSNFSETLYYAREGLLKSLLTWSTAYSKDEAEIHKNIIKNVDAQNRVLHKALELEGFTIPAQEKANGDFLEGTAAAVVLLQNKYASQILTGTGLTTGSGVVNDKTKAFLNQKYGCIQKAVINLISPDGPTVKARGEVLPIIWSASNIPNEATLTISSVKADNTGTTTISVQTIKNGRGTYNWTIPNTFTAGSYKVQLVISGAIKSDISAKSFDIRETALELITQNTAETYGANQRVDIKWKTSTAISPNANLKLQMITVPPAGSNASAAIYDIATVKNTGSYSWLVPEKIGNQIVANGGQYKLAIATTEGLSVSDLSNAAFTISNFVRQISLTSPAASTTVAQGDTLTLQWNQSNLTGNVSIVAKEKITSGTPVVQDFGLAPVTAGSKAIAIPLTLKPATYVFTIQNTTAGVNASSSREIIVAQKTRSLTVVSPNGGERVGTSTTFEIVWNATGIDSTVRSIKVNLIDTVQNKTVLVKDAPVTDRKTTFTMPVNGVLGALSGIGTYADARYKIEVQAMGLSGALFSDQSNANFIINRNTPTLQITAPVSTSKLEIASLLRVDWTYSNILVPNRVATVELVNASGTTVQVISTTATRLDSKMAQANLAATVPAGNYKVRVSAVLIDGTPVQAESGLFEITNKIPAVTVTQPNALVELKFNTGVPIAWTVRNLPTSVNAYEIYLVDTEANKIQKITSVGKMTLSYPWSIPANGILGTGSGQITNIGDSAIKKYKIEVRAIDVLGTEIAKDQSDNNFSIVR